MRAAKIGKVIERFAAFTLIAAISWVGNVWSQPGSHEESAKSVVKIMSRFAGGKVESGSGFVWSQKDYVVTALHVVAGAASITVYSEALKKEREADIIAVHQESDLALLKLKTNDLALTPLKVASAPPNLKDEHYIWGYPRDVNSMQGDDIRFSLSLNQQQQPTLGNIFKSESEFESVVGKQGYPKYQTKILRVSSSIQPGHSGAPIFDRTGVVVGVGDGGLHQGIARINWAIPVQIYLPNLPTSKDPKPVQPSKQANLYSAHAGPAIEVKSAPRKVKTKDGNVRTLKAQSLHLAWSASVAEALELVTAEDLKALQKISAEVSKNSSVDLHKEMIDVYEDYSVGATVAVPHGLKLSYAAKDHMFEAWSPSKRVGMFVRFQKNKTRKIGKQAMQVYEQSLRTAPTVMASLRSLFGSSDRGQSAYEWEDAQSDPEWVEEEAFPENWEEESDPEMMVDEGEEGGGEEALGEDEVLMEEELPADEEPAIDEEPPADEEPAVDEEPPADEEPAVDEESPADEEPAVDEEPPADEEPAVDEEPPADEEPAVDEEPPTDEEPAVDEEPPADEEPAVDEEPPADEEPVIDEEPSADEDEPPFDLLGNLRGPFGEVGYYNYGGGLLRRTGSPAANVQKTGSKSDFRTETFKLLKDRKGGKQGEMFTSFVFDGPNFLGTSVIVYDFKSLSRADWATYYMMVLCSKLAAFSVE